MQELRGARPGPELKSAVAAALGKRHILKSSLSF